MVELEIDDEMVFTIPVTGWYSFSGGRMWLCSEGERVSIDSADTVPGRERQAARRSPRGKERK